MAILTCIANSTSELGNLRVGSWSKGYARQGSYGGNLSRGLVVFSELKDNVMVGKNITKIGLKFQSASAGWNRSKTLYVRQTTKTTFSGSSTAWVGSLLGGCTGKFYNNTVTIADLATAHPSLYTALRDYLMTGARSLALYHNESSTSGHYSTNYLQFEKVTLIIYYCSENLWRYDGEKWVACRAYYYNGTDWILCDASYNNAGVWEA